MSTRTEQLKQQLRPAANQQNGQKEPPKNIFGFLTRYQSEIARALPSHMNPERMARVAMTEVRKTPKLLDCDPKSLFGAIIQASQLGLEPGNALGHAYLIPFDRWKKQGKDWVKVGTDVNLIIGYRGMIDLARRSGQILSLSARCVHQNDEFSYAYGLDEELRHVPATGERGELVYVYAVARLSGGGVQFEVMSRAAVEKIRNQSKAKDDGPWVTHFEAMAQKTVVRQLFKYLPVSVEIQRAISLDEQADAGIAQDHGLIIDGEVDWGAPEPDAGANGAAAEAPKPEQAKPAVQEGQAVEDDTTDLLTALREAESPEDLERLGADVQGLPKGKARAEAEKALAAAESRVRGVEHG